MGCGVSNEFVPPPPPGAVGGPFKTGAEMKAPNATEPFGEVAPPNGEHPSTSRQSPSPAGGPGEGGDGASGAAAPGDAPKLLGKTKYIKDYGAHAMEDRGSDSAAQGTLFLFCDEKTDDLIFSYWDIATSTAYARTFSDKDLTDSKSAQSVRLPWAPFFKSLATAMLKGKAVVSSPAPERREVSYTISSKESAAVYPFVVRLSAVNQGQEQRGAVVAYVMAPMTRALQQMRQQSSRTDAAHHIEQIGCEVQVCTASVRRYKETVERLLPLIRPLREESAAYSHVAMTKSRDVRVAERQLRERMQQRITKHPLDSMYEDGGAQAFQHAPWSPAHVPHEEEPDETLTACIRAAFPLAPGASLRDISQVLEKPDLKMMIDANGNRGVILEAFEIFKGIDQWDYDTIQLEIITNGNSLFYTTYLLMYKLDLVRHFNIDDETLRNFLVAVQSSYHPNPYHNAMHGADVTQINYYIMMVAGLSEKCKLSKEEILAGLVAGAVHDFDHPGLNNNFHTRTNAYLATLYNDRSILENHHVACTFELLRSPKYNILATLSEEQRLVIRVTILEMVLATDMGNHAKIFKSFQVRMSEATDWHSKKEDVHLALSMSIKMADISNCARPNHIYAEWAKNISKEFYIQGDAERQLALSISPFMDRTKEVEEFPKGQISFMMYIVQPMVEAISDLLPSLKFAVNLCSENKEYWKNKTAT